MKLKAGDKIKSRSSDVVREIVKVYKDYYFWKYPDLPTGPDNLFSSMNSTDPLTEWDKIEA